MTNPYNRVDRLYLLINRSEFRNLLCGPHMPAVIEIWLMQYRWLMSVDCRFSTTIVSELCVVIESIFFTNVMSIPMLIIIGPSRIFLVLARGEERGGGISPYFHHPMVPR